jgi:hypothetical protein
MTIAAAAIINIPSVRPARGSQGPLVGLDSAPVGAVVVVWGRGGVWISGVPVTGSSG